MVSVAFFEKPGCVNNTRQKVWLRERGVRVDTIDLLTYGWSEAELLKFFAALPVSDWFNRSAPRIKSGEVIPEQLSQAQALQTLLAEPLLIRRPLLRRGNDYRVGFDSEQIAQWLAIRGDDGQDVPGESCPRPEQPCEIGEGEK
jgi:nitrogenase-associated protein